MVRDGTTGCFPRTEGRRGHGTVYVLLEDERPIGQVVAPVGEPVLAWGAGTVLLRREPERRGAAA
jgi:hypothetical protein